MQGGHLQSEVRSAQAVVQCLDPDWPAKHDLKNHPAILCLATCFAVSFFAVGHEAACALDIVLVGLAFDVAGSRSRLQISVVAVVLICIHELMHP